MILRTVCVRYVFCTMPNGSVGAQYSVCHMLYSVVQCIYILHVYTAVNYYYHNVHYSPVCVLFSYFGNINISYFGLDIGNSPALRRVVRGDYLRDMSYPLPPAHCMQGLLACNGAYELG